MEWRNNLKLLSKSSFLINILHHNVLRYKINLLDFMAPFHGYGFNCPNKQLLYKNSNSILTFCLRAEKTETRSEDDIFVITKNFTSHKLMDGIAYQLTHFFSMSPFDTLKTSENQRFSDVFREIKTEH